MEEKLHECINEQIQLLSVVYGQAGKLIKKTQLKQQLYLDHRLNEPMLHKFKIREYVLLHQIRIENQLNAKLVDKWKGLYYIHDILGNGAYRLRRKDGMILSKSVHGNRLKLYRFPHSLQLSDNVDK